MRPVALAVLILALAACQGPVYRDTAVAMRPVAEVDLARYAGRWYEIARFPVSFQEGCVAVTADYALRDDGRVDVLNACRIDSLEGERETATAIARSVDDSGAILKVRFIRWLPIEGDYWILHLDPDYSTAVVGLPSGSAGWILSRTPEIEPRHLDRALTALELNGYDLSRLDFTLQAPDAVLPLN